MTTLKWAINWAGIEGAMKLANRNPAYRPQVESLMDAYFTVIDKMAAEGERRDMTGNDKIWTI